MEEQPFETTADAGSVTEPETMDDAGDALLEEDIQGLLDKIQQLTDERNDLQQQVLRTMADFQNYRKRNQQEAANLRQYAVENFVRELLPVVDNFERTLAHLREGASAEAMLGGIEAVDRQLKTVLDGQNLKRIAALGEPFDPNLHEAVGFEVTPDYPADTVAVEIEPGYRLADRIIRPARVKVAQAP